MKKIFCVAMILFISTMNEILRKYVTESVKINAGIPDSPEILYIYRPGPREVVVIWIPPSYRGQSPILGYRVEQLTRYGKWDTLKLIKEKKLIYRTNLDIKPGMETIVGVTAFNAEGESDPAIRKFKYGLRRATATIFTSKVPAPPGAPVLVPDPDEKPKLLWTNPSGDLVNGYHVESRTHNDDPWRDCLDVEEDRTEAQITCMHVAGKAYAFRVRSRSIYGVLGLPSTNTSYYLALQKDVPKEKKRPKKVPISRRDFFYRGTPEEPRLLNAYRKSSDKAFIKWMRTLSEGYAPVMGYRVDRLNAQGEWETILQTKNDFFFYPYVVGEETILSVATYNAIGSSERRLLKFKFGDKNLKKGSRGVFDVFGPPGHPVLGRDSDMNLKLFWTNPREDPVAGYRVEILEGDQETWTKCVDVKRTQFKARTETPIPCLKEGKIYSFRVRAFNKVGVFGPPSEFTSFYEAQRMDEIRRRKD